MTLDLVISTEDMKERLRSLADHLPDEHPAVHAFGPYVADKLNERAEPHGFVLSAHLALDELRSGECSGPLAGYSSHVYAFLRLSVPAMARAACPAEFARRVEIYHRRVLDTEP